MNSLNSITKSVLEQWEMLRHGDGIVVSKKSVVSMLTLFKSLLYPEDPFKDEDITGKMVELKGSLTDLLNGLTDDPEAAVNTMMNEIPYLIRMLNKDAEAIYNGDPSARTVYEITSCYPGFQAVFGYRIAHIIYRMNIPVLPRLICEYYHSLTGIDIHPGAVIGDNFCIDHGTGIVIGETTTIGNNVRIYHGVTLGVKNFRKDDNGNLLKGYKRHPDVGNDVILYANATVMGNITLGDGCIIGANAVVTRDVKNGELVKF